MIGTTATMPPAIDRSTPRACMICKAVKAPDAFKSARKCVDCEARVAGDAAAAYRLANRPAGAKSTVADFLEDQWTLTECKERREIKQPYLKLSDLSPAFLGDVEPPVIDAKITDADGRVAHKMACKTSVSFCPIPWCMAHAGYKMCTKCTHVRPLADFNRQSTGVQLRGDCRDCQHGICAARRVDDGAARRSAASAGETRVCVGACGGEKSVLNFDGARKECNSCRSKKFEDGQRAKAAAAPAELRFCPGSRLARPVSEFTPGLNVSDRRRALDAAKDARPERRAYHNALQAKKKYYAAWRERQLETRPEEYRARNAEAKNKYYADHKEVIGAQEKCRPSHQLRSIKAGASGRGVEWALDDDFALALIGSPCFYSGVHEPDVHATGIDRVDSASGYVAGNVVPCNGFVNLMKGGMDVWEFVELCAAAADGDGGDAVRKMRARYDACIVRNMKPPMPFEELCAAVAGHFDPGALP